jgi:FkbM family methyltransferase
MTPIPRSYFVILYIKTRIKLILCRYNIFRKFFYNYKSNRKLHVFKKINLNKNSKFLDIGGNFGLVSQYIYDKFKCNIFIYEPHPGCVIELKTLFKNNKKVKIYNKAVSNKTGVSKLYLHKDSKSFFDLAFSQSTSLEKRKNLNKNKFRIIKIVTLKEIIKKLKYIDLLKIDIEGHEYKLLPFIFKNLDKFGKIYCELHGKGKLKHIYSQKNYNYWVKKIKKNPNYNKKFFIWY